MNRKMPMALNSASMFTVSAVPIAGSRNRLRSISGSASRCWRRTNSAPTTSPITMASRLSELSPSSAIRFTP